MRAFSTVAIWLLAVVTIGCGDDGSGAGGEAGGDADTDADSDTGADSDADADTGGDPGPLALEEGPFVIRQVDSGHVAFPDVARLEDDSLLLVYREAAIHMVDSTARIVGQSGTADGLDWSEPEVLVDTPDIDDRDPSLRLLADGDVALGWFRYRYEPTDDGEMSVHQIFFARSGDGGQSWGEASMVPPYAMEYPGAHIDQDQLWVDSGGDPVRVTACSHPVVEMDGELLAQSYGGLAWNSGNPDAPRSRISLFASDDGGESWIERPLAHAEAEDTWLQEPALLALDENEWMVHARTSPGSNPSYLGRTWQIRSHDGGQSWGEWEPLDFYGHAPYLTELSDGTLLVAVRELNEQATQAAVAVSYSLDDGQSWSDPMHVVSWLPTELGYPSIAELADGRVLIVYYQGGVSIRGAIYSVQAS